MDNGLKVIIITLDNDYYNFLREQMTKDDTYEIIIRVSNLLSLENKLSYPGKNLIIIDSDTVNVNDKDLKNVVDVDSILIIMSSQENIKHIELMKLGIKEFVLKPILTSNYSKENYLSMIRLKLNKSNILNARIPLKTNTVIPKTTFTSNTFKSSNQKIIAIASSTGGTEALERVFRELPLDCPPIVVVQHMPTGFTKLFAERLNNFCKPEIREAKDNDELKKGLVLIAPADQHMSVLKNSNASLYVRCYVGNKIHGVMPSADVLFESVANIMKDKAVGVILTGMGADGGRGLMMMHNNGAKTIGQNKETCVVYGMPKVAFELGAVDIELPICDICKKMLQYT